MLGASFPSGLTALPTGGREAAAAQASPPAVFGLDSDPAPDESRNQDRKGNEVTVEVGKESGPQGVLVDGESRDDARGCPP